MTLPFGKKAFLFAYPGLVAVLAWIGVPLYVTKNVKSFGQDRSELAVADRSPGHSLYQTHCAYCHGPDGRGDGMAGIDPKARYFGWEQYKFVTTPNRIPTDADLKAVLKRGIPGSAMPSFAELSESDLDHLVAHLRGLTRAGIAAREAKLLGEEYNAPEHMQYLATKSTPAEPIAIPANFPPPTSMAIANGKKLFAERCASCHGAGGKGDGNSNVPNEEGLLIKPRDLTRGIYRGGGEPADLYARIALGFGKSMPSNVDLPAAAIIDLVHFVRDLGGHYRTTPKADYRGLAAVDAKTAWIGGTNGTIARTTDGGATWQNRSPRTDDKLDFRDLEAFGANVAFALAAGPGPLSQIWKTADGGQTWAKQFVLAQPKGFLDAIAFWDESNGVAIGDPVEGRFQLVRTTDGTNWTVEPGPTAIEGEGAFAASGTCLIANGPNDLWLVTGAKGQSRILHSQDRGKTWTARDGFPAGAEGSSGLFGLHRDGNTVIAVGGDYTKPTEIAKTAVVTVDAGKSWAVIDGKLPFCSAVTRTKTGWLAVGPGGTFRSPDGVAWARIDGQSRNSIAVSKDGTVWYCGERGDAGIATVPE
jgi:photosystem II stability/assembly factor-like uncharacterized protein/mono/diheme cytochrome c family protein